MMREIINIAIGQCGLQVAQAFWTIVLKEHGLEMNGTPSQGSMNEENKYQGVFFDQISDSKFVPRAILVDLEPNVIDQIFSGKMKDLFDSKNVVKGIPGAANNWARGHNTEGGQFIDQLMAIVEKSVEKTQSLQGFIITHSIGGGTGSGFGSLIIEKLKEKYPRKKIFTFSVFPSPLISDSVVEPYNSILSMNVLKNFADEVVVLDNHALYDIATKKLKRSATYNDLNEIIALVMSSITASLRFHGKLNTDLGEFLVNLVPFPTNHFLMASFAPLMSDDDSGYMKLDIKSMTAEIFNENNFCAAAELDKGVYLSTVALFRGSVSAQEVDQNLAEIRKTLKYASYVPTGMKIGMIDVAPPKLDKSGLALVNHTSISQIFDRILDQFNVMFDNNAFVHWYEAEGLTKDEIANARDSVAELSESYKNAQKDE